METAELLKKVRRIELKTKGLSKHIFSGEYHSAFKGRGMSFSEVRGYQYGDDVRNIDWNVTARTGEAHVKMFEEERELSVLLLIDVSRSAYFGSVEQLKKDLIVELCATLAFSAMQNNDKVGVLFFSATVEKFIPPKKGRQHILRIIRELIDMQPRASGTDISRALRFANNVVHKRSIAFIVSDFIAPDYEDALRVLSKRHDVVGIHVSDPRERELPDVGLMYVENAETGEDGWIDSSSAQVRERYAAHFRQFRQRFDEVCKKTSTERISISTEGGYVGALLGFFKRRHIH